MALEDKKSVFSKGVSTPGVLGGSRSSSLASNTNQSRQAPQNKRSLLSFNNAGGSSTANLAGLTSLFQAPSTGGGATGATPAIVITDISYESTPVVPLPPTNFYYQESNGSSDYFESGYYQTT